MKKYAKVINEETKLCNVGLGINTDFYKSIGMEEMEVEEAYDNNWYVLGYAPAKPEPTKEEQRENRAFAYTKEVDPITCNIDRLRDEEQTEEIIAEIEQLKLERNVKVEEIKARYPYPVGDEETSE